jgi:uncharacterized RmlC-like cupin family protein
MTRPLVTAAKLPYIPPDPASPAFTFTTPSKSEEDRAVSSSDDVHVVGPSMSRAIVGPQGQHLVPCITTETAGSHRLSAGLVVMPPGTSSQVHHHSRSDIVVMCVQGWAASLVGPELEPRLHGPGEFIYVPAGVLHMAVNLSTTDELVAVETRTDPRFNEDVVVFTELQAAGEAVAAALRAEFDVEAALAARKDRSPRLPPAVTGFDVVGLAERAFTR